VEKRIRVTLGYGEYRKVKGLRSCEGSKLNACEVVKPVLRVANGDVRVDVSNAGWCG